MWLLLKDTDGDFSIVWAESVSMITQRLGHKLGRVTYNPDAGVPETFTDVTEIAVHYNLDVAIRKMAESCNPPGDVTKNVRACRVCGCTDSNCLQCIQKTGEPCSWVEADLCSACVGDAELIADIDKAEGEPESPYARVLRTKVCPHCSADIGSNIWDCPACDRSLDSEDGKGKLEAARDLDCATGDESPWPAPGVPTIGDPAEPKRD